MEAGRRSRGGDGRGPEQRGGSRAGRSSGGGAEPGGGAGPAGGAGGGGAGPGGGARVAEQERRSRAGGAGAPEQGRRGAGAAEQGWRRPARRRSIEDLAVLGERGVDPCIKTVQNPFSTGCSLQPVRKGL